MKTGEAIFSFRQRKAIDRGRKISNATISLILSFVVTAAAQSERINTEGRILGPTPVHSSNSAAVLSNEAVIRTPSSGTDYKLPKHGAKATLTIINGF